MTNPILLTFLFNLQVGKGIGLKDKDDTEVISELGENCPLDYYDKLEEMTTHPSKKGQKRKYSRDASSMKQVVLIHYI